MIFETLRGSWTHFLGSFNIKLRFVTGSNTLSKSQHIVGY